MRYDTEHKQRTREKVVHEASEAIRQHGPDKVGVAGLMAKAGLTHGGFYAHFKSKDDLITEAITYMFDDQYEGFRKHFDGVGPAEGFANYIDMYLSARHRERRNKGCPVVALSSDLVRMPLAARKRFDAGIQRMKSSLADIFKMLQLPQPDSIASSVLAEMVGALAIARSVTNVEFAEQILDAARENIKRRVGIPLQGIAGG